MPACQARYRARDPGRRTAVEGTLVDIEVGADVGQPASVRRDGGELCDLGAYQRTGPGRVAKPAIEPGDTTLRRHVDDEPAIRGNRRAIIRSCAGGGNG